MVILRREACEINYYNINNRGISFKYLFNLANCLPLKLILLVNSEVQVHIGLYFEVTHF